MPEQQQKRPRWQIGLRTLFLLMTVVAVWTVYFSNRSAIRHYEERITSMRPLTRELSIKDEGMITVVKLEPYWYDENRWAIYLPEGAYRLCLATREVDQTGLGPIVASAPLAAGEHVLTLEQKRAGDGWSVTVDCDDTTVLKAEEPKAWYPSSGLSGGSMFDRNEQVVPDKPVVLFRRRFAQPPPSGSSTTPTGPIDGILLWIERSSGAISTQPGES